MKQLLECIAENTSSKTSMSIAVSDQKTKFLTKFNPPIQLNNNKKIRTSVSKYRDLLLFFLISMKKETILNILLITEPEFRLPVGCCTLEDINDAVQRGIKKNGHNEKKVTLEANSITLKTIL